MLPLQTLASSIVLAALFFVLGKFADVVVRSARTFGERFGIPLSFLGIGLGFLTSLPELSVGVNAAAQGIAEISIGNLLGGIVVLLGLVLGVSVIVERRIETNGKHTNILPVVSFLFLPVLLGLDGTFSVTEGLVLMFGYCFILYHLFTQERPRGTQERRIETSQASILRAAFAGVFGLAVIIAASHFIIDITSSLLERFSVPTFIVGLIVFSIGTNLPEISISIRSWTQRVHELSLANLIGSTLANGFLVGLIATLGSVNVAPIESFYYLAVVISVLLAAFLGFWKSDHAFTRREGFALVTLYLVFVLSQLTISTAFTASTPGTLAMALW